MADFTFECPSCKQAIQCDDAWSGHQIQCPICQAGLVVPANTPPPAPTPTHKEVSHLGHQLVAVPKGGSKLATAQSTNVARSSFGAGKRFEKKEVKKQSPLVKVGIVGAVVVVLAAAAYIAWPHLQKMQENMNLKRRQAEKESGGGEAGHIADVYSALDATDPNRIAASSGSSSRRDGPSGEEIAEAAASGAAPAQPAVNTNAVIKPTWTLDVKKAEIPDGKANGLIAGTNFVYESARLDRSGTQYLLTLRQGKGATPDRGVALYLRANPGETTTNQNWTISQDMTGTTVSKIWKTDPKYQAKTQNYFKGYALKLELGAMSETGTVPGKIFLAFPDTEKSVIAGNFIASTASAVAQPGYDAAAQAQPTAAESAEAAAQRARFQQRYGIKR